MSADAVAQDQIKAFVERIMRLREEAKAIAGDIREVYAEAKGNGFDKTILGKLVLYVEKRATDSAAMQEQDALFDLYLSAFDGASSHTHAHAREDYDAETGEITEPDEPQPPPEAAVNPAAHIETPAEESTLAQEPSEPEGSGGMQDEMAIHPPTHSNPAEVPPLPSAVGGDDRRAESSPAAPVVPSNVTPLRTHDPATHFLNSKGLTRLHGCQGPEACASSQPRVKLCFACSVANDGPAPNIADGAA